MTSPVRQTACTLIHNSREVPGLISFHLTHCPTSRARFSSTTHVNVRSQHKRVKPNPTTETNDDSFIPWNTNTSANAELDVDTSSLPPPFSLPPPPWPQDHTSQQSSSTWMNRPQTSHFVPQIQLEGVSQPVSHEAVPEDIDRATLSKNKKKKLERAGVLHLSAYSAAQSQRMREYAAAAAPELLKGLSAEHRGINAPAGMHPKKAVRWICRQAEWLAAGKTGVDPQATIQRQKLAIHGGAAIDAVDIPKPSTPNPKPMTKVPRSVPLLAKDLPAYDASKPRIRSKKEMEQWQIQKDALKNKFPDGWKPFRRMSPEALDGIKALRKLDPERFTTPVLAQHFKISPEAIRRILSSAWVANSEQEEARRQRWDKRGETIWKSLVEKGVHPPKKWRQMGIGGGPRYRSQDGTRREHNENHRREHERMKGESADSNVPWEI